jgi:hypothetical protein
MVTQERMMAVLSATFGTLAVLLAAVGLYDVMAYGVSQRTGERIEGRPSIRAFLRPVDVTARVRRRR